MTCRLLNEKNEKYIDEYYGRKTQILKNLILQVVFQTLET